MMNWNLSGKKLLTINRVNMKFIKFMTENRYSIFHLLLIDIILGVLYVNWYGRIQCKHADEIKTLKKQAVESGSAQYVTDSNGVTSFTWNTNK